MLLVCKSVGNPDHGQYAPLSEPEYFIITNYEQASAAAAAYIEMWDLGGGNWNDGSIYNKDGEKVARVSYNSRVWSISSKGETAVGLDRDAVGKFHAFYKAKYQEMVDAYCREQSLPTHAELFND